MRGINCRANREEMEKLQKIARLYRTIRHLKLVQISNRLKRKVFHHKINTSPAPNISNLANIEWRFIGRPQSYLGKDRFVFLNREESIVFPQGWNDKNLQKLWLYNLHYFEGLLDDKASAELKNYIIQQWIDQNPPVAGNGWEPYPTSLRIVNWIKWALSGNKLSSEANQSLATQVRHLCGNIEYHLLGNHLFVNAKALVYAGLYFDGEEAQGWYRRGIEILIEQIPEQFLSDGAHFELSTTYHALLTEDLLDILQYMKNAGKEISPSWVNKAQSAVNWLRVMTRPDGFPPLFNDAAYGITPSLEDIFSLANFIGIESQEQLEAGMIDLPASGYFRYSTDDYSVFGDAGQIGPEYIPGHAHCDMLNFELFAHGVPVIVDTGTSTYEVGERRQIERGTASHNTVQIGNEEQSEIWGAFRVARRAKLIDRTINSNSAVAEYVGYKSREMTHRRQFLFENKVIVIEDQINQEGLAVARIHLHPDVAVILYDQIAEAGKVRIQFLGAETIDLKDYEYAPEFNKKLIAKVLEITFKHRLTTKINL